MKKLLTALVIAWMLGACTGANTTPEDEIREYIDRGIAAAENRDSAELAEMVDAQYQDKNGMDKKQLRSMLHFYFLRHKNIYLFRKIDEIVLLSKQAAHVSLYVAMAGSAISDASMLANLRARVYRFELELVKPDGEWLLKSARWQAASPGDLQ